MTYLVRLIKRKEDIEACEKFQVSHAQWRCVMRPKTYGYLGYLEGRGLFLRMICEEQDPVRRRTGHGEAVWKDSAMEMFLAFSNSKSKKADSDCLYVNLEVNANGAMYAQYGHGRKNRCFVPQRFYEESGVCACVEEKRWWIELLVPEWFLAKMCGDSPESATYDGEMFCNFYKISEDPEIEHYLSFSEIQSDKPNFHLPSYFAQAEIERPD